MRMYGYPSSKRRMRLVNLLALAILLLASRGFGQMPPVCGDVNGDGRVDIGDAQVVTQFVVGLRQCGTAPFGHPDVCDVNPDGRCDVGDALKIAQCDVGLISCSFGCPPFACP